MSASSVRERAELTLSGLNARVVAAEDAVALEGAKLLGYGVLSADFLIVRGWAGLAPKKIAKKSNFCLIFWAACWLF